MNPNKIKTLVLGGTGFLGKHIKEAFKPHDDTHLVTYLGSRYDLTDQTQTTHAFEDHRPDVVIHAAALAGGIKANSERPADFLRINTQLAINVVESCRKFNVKYLYALGSVCSYPLHCPVPFREDDIWNGKPESTNFPYAQAKRTLMTLQQAYRDQYGLRGAHLIPVNLYGPHDHFDLNNSHVIPALINKFTTAVKENQPVVYCWGTGTGATREFIYAGDAAEAIVSAVTQQLDTSLPINIGTGVDISIKDLAGLIGRISGFTGRIEFTGEVSDGQPRRRLDISRAQELLSFRAQTKLEDGLARTITWYREING